MAWSTRQLAELAGTTVNTIRHYHRLGLLEEPDRRHNGYKQYGVPHLVCLLRIRRLVELGVPLSEIVAAQVNGDVPPEVLRQVDAHLAAEIERLTKARSAIADAMKDPRRMAETDDGPVNAEMDALPADADEVTRQDLAERLAPVIAMNLTDHPWLNDPGARHAKSENVTMQTFVEAVVALYNPAQVDVLTRASLLAHQRPRPDDTNPSDPSVRPDGRRRT